MLGIYAILRRRHAKKRAKVAPMPKSIVPVIVPALMLLQLVILMTSLVAWGFSSAKLAHDLEHVGHSIPAIANHQHNHEDTLQHESDGAGHPADINNYAEHKVLHAVDHLQLFAHTNIPPSSTLELASIAPWHFTEWALPLANLRPPFRPPRSMLLA